MTEKIKVNVKIMENVTKSEVERLAEGLSKIEGFEFLVDSFFIVKCD